LDKSSRFYLGRMNKKTYDTIDEVTRFLELVNKHLKEKNCKHTIVEVAKEVVDSKK
jgi:hypothetical protein